MAGMAKMPKSDWLMAIIFAVIIIIQAAQVFCRYILNDSLVWAEELSRYLFAWLIMIGAVIAIKERKHIFIDIIISRLSKKKRIFIDLLISLSVISFSILITFSGFNLVYNTQNTLSPALGLPVNYAFYASLPVLSIFAIVISWKNFIEDIKRLKQKNNEEEN